MMKYIKNNKINYPFIFD